VRSMDHHLATPSPSRTVVAYLFVGLFAFAPRCFVPRLVRGRWWSAWWWRRHLILEDFGASSPGRHRPNSGLLVALVAATFWPIRRSRSLGAASESSPIPRG